MIDDPAKRAEQQQSLIQDQAEYLLEGHESQEAPLKQSRKALAHARNAAFSLNGFERNFFFENTGEKHRHLGAVSGIDSNIDARSFATGDLDRDGDLDLVVKNLQVRLLQCFENEIPSEAHRAFFRCRGVDSNRDGIGTRIEIRHGGRLQMSYVKSANGFQSQSPNEVFFGLGADALIDRVDVYWPSGKHQTFEKVAADRDYLIHEADGIDAGRPLERAVAQAAKAAEGERIDGRRKRVFSKVRNAPLFGAEDLDGESISALELYKGGDALIVFMTTWTATYDEDLAQLAELAKNHPELQIVLFLVTVNPIRSSAEGMEAARASGLRVGECELKLAEKFTQQPNVVFPWSFLVSGSKVVLDVAVGPGSEEAAAAISRALND